jgi:hypothetical protein
VSDLPKRACTIVVDTVLVEGLRTTFKATKSSKKEPNTCEVSVYNLSKDSRAQMQKKHAKVILQAGYSNQVKQIFSGDARTVDHIRNGPDWITKIQCGDGEHQYQFSRLSSNFGPNTPVAQVVQAVAKSMNLDVSAVPGAIVDMKDTFLQGYSAYGKSAVELERLLTSRGYSWSIQDGRIQILKGEETVKGTALLFTEKSGLIGSPEHGTPDKKGKPSVLKVKVLLTPELKPGSLIRVESVGTNGNFRVEKVVHSGDTYSNDWYSELEVKPFS